MKGYRILGPVYLVLALAIIGLTLPRGLDFILDVKAIAGIFYFLFISFAMLSNIPSLIPTAKVVNILLPIVFAMAFAFGNPGSEYAYSGKIVAFFILLVPLSIIILLNHFALKSKQSN